jgi:uncharacterized protein DUF3108
MVMLGGAPYRSVAGGRAVTRTSRLSILVAAGALSVGALSVSAHAATPPDPNIPLYTATYGVQYDGKDLGLAEFKVQYDEGRGLYEFSSHTTVKGFLKLARPNPVIERSQFQVVDGRIRALEFWYEDGSRKGEDNAHIVFEWDRNVAVVSNKDGRREVALQPGALDRGSVQVAVMRDLATTGKTTRYWLTDEDSTTAYEYTDHGDATTATGIGQLATKSLMQQRDGSSRSTWIWVAPELKFLPVYVEQRREGEVRSAFRLQSVEGLPRGR